MDSISLDSITSIKASQMLPNTYSPLRKKFPTQDFTITLRNWCNTAFLKRQQCLRHLDRICRRHQTYQWLYPPVEYRLLQPLGNRRRMHSSFEAVYRNWSTPSAMARLLRTADEKELFSNKELKDFVADHDRYWNRCQQTERYVASQNRGRTQDRLFRPQCRRYENRR